MSNQLKEIPSGDFETFWTRIRAALAERPDVVDPSDTTFDCISVANEVGRRLIENGHTPRALFIANRAMAVDRDDAAPIHFIRPKIFDGEVAWSCHVVCEAEGLIYDPLLPEPLPRDQYLSEMFDEEVTVNPLIAT